MTTFRKLPMTAPTAAAPPQITGKGNVKGFCNANKMGPWVMRGALYLAWGVLPTFFYSGLAAGGSTCAACLRLALPNGRASAWCCFFAFPKALGALERRDGRQSLQCLVRPLHHENHP